LIFLTLQQSISLSLSSFDVIHSYGINSLHYRIDAIPGRFNFLYYYYLSTIGLNKGYCYELCGIGHFSMQIIVVIISNLFIIIMMGRFG
jgi:cytochrome c oxidase subunit 2